MKVFLLALASVFVFASTAAAQTHPCDLPPVTVVQTNGPVALSFCLAPADADGNPLPLSAVSSVRITMDGTVVFNGPLASTGAPAADGRGYFETPKTFTLTKGAHRMIVFASIADGEGPGSDPFDWTLKGVPPGKPIVKGPKK
jgi:hypothetical protein